MNRRSIEVQPIGPGVVDVRCREGERGAERVVKAARFWNDPAAASAWGMAWLEAGNAGSDAERAEADREASFREFEARNPTIAARFRGRDVGVS